MKTTVYLYFCWIVALVATAGSLFFSEVMHFYPCVLCWYQRIAMYPLAFIFLAALLTSDSKVLKYTLPLTISGWVIASYHLLLYFEIIPESAAPCVGGVPCTTTYIQWFGFITIPMLSFIAFSLLLGAQIRF
ncbi:disulfide bond formation protein B, partial [bacterium]|nr:disulfide bond formation protein B [bacterium]